MIVTRKNGVRNLVAIVASVLAVIGMIWTGLMQLDSRYARAEDFKTHLNQHKVDATETKLLILQNRQETLSGRLYEIRRHGRGGDAEASEAHALDQEILNVGKQIEQYRQELLKLKTP